MKYLKIFFIVFISSTLYGQIDTTDWYPLHIGDKREFYGLGMGYAQAEVVGDTLMPNGQTYFIFTGGVYVWRFQRRVDNVVYYYNTADGNEYILFDFTLTDGELWQPPFEPFWWGIYKTGIDSDNLENDSIPYKLFDRAIIDTISSPPDTTWGYLMDAYPTRITKGFGITSYSYGLTTLVGAVINGKEYGTLVGINENKDILNEFHLFQNYPNPFNAQTTITYSINQSGPAKLVIYNLLGEKIKTLVDQNQIAGNYEIEFDGANLASGIYIYKLSSCNLSASKKLILMK